MSLRSIYNRVPSISTQGLFENTLFENTRVAEWNSHGEAQIRQGLRAEISKMFDKVYFSITPTIDPTTAQELGIQCEKLDLVTYGGERRHGNFFKSRPSAWLALHPVDPEDRNTAKHIVSFDREWQVRTNNVGGNYAEAEMVSAALSYAFRYYERIIPFEDAPAAMGTRGCADSYTLEEISGWESL